MKLSTIPAILLMIIGISSISLNAVTNESILEKVNECWKSYMLPRVNLRQAITIKAKDLPAIWLESVQPSYTTIMLDCLKQNNIPGRDYVNPIWHENVWLKAIKNNQLDVLQWLKSNNIPGLGYALKQKGYDSIWSNAITHNSIEILDWLKANILPKGEDLTELVFEASPEIWHTAVQANSIKGLQWLLDNNISGADYIDKEKKNLWLNAIYYASPKTEVLHWLKKNNIPGSDDIKKQIKTIVRNLIDGGNGRALGWLLENNFIDNKAILEIVPEPYKKYLQLNRIEEDPGSIELIRTLLKHKVPGAAYVDKDGNNIWLDASRAFNTYTYPGDDLVKFYALLDAHKIPGIAQKNKAGMNIWLSAVKAGYPKALDWLRDKNIPGLTHTDNKGQDAWSYEKIESETVPWRGDSIRKWLERHKVPKHN